MTKQDRHSLWDAPMEEARECIQRYDFEFSHDFTEDDHKLLDSYIEYCGRQHARKTVNQLTQVIESDMDDQGIEDFVYGKLNSDNFSATGGFRDALIRVRDYIMDINQSTKRGTEQDLWHDPIEETKTLFCKYYCKILKNVAENKEEHALLDLYIEDCDDKDVLKTVGQLTKIINSDMDDQEVEDFILKKLNSDFLPETGEARKWLIRIRDYIARNRSHVPL